MCVADVDTSGGDTHWLQSMKACWLEMPLAPEVLWPLLMLNFALWVAFYFRSTATLQSCLLGIEICDCNARVEVSPAPLDLHSRKGSFAAKLHRMFGLAYGKYTFLNIDEPVLDVKVRRRLWWCFQKVGCCDGGMPFLKASDDTAGVVKCRCERC